MEPCLSYKVKPLLLCFLMLSLLVVHLASAVPTSRSMQLRNLHHPPALKLSPMQEMVAALGKVQLQAKATTSMDAEVNDYPSPGANNRHHPPKGPEVNDYPSPGANNRHHPPKGPGRG
uniref:Uncharacterized protein n=1 Tax=Avena sativa TaxID=4498 RepID=A0ACD5XD89_AVESA